MFPIVQTALSIVNARRDELGDSKDALVEAWLKKSLDANPDSTSLLGLKADLLEMQKKYEDAENVYERILATPGFAGILRARVLNNLAYLLALQKKESPRALRLIEEARVIRGPSSDILDTEAVVHMANGNHSAAIANLELAVTEEANAEKWFHLARAYWSANNREKAVQAWARAQDLGIGPEKLNRMEHEAFHEFSKEMEREQNKAGAAS
jgi:tetratricopeptide (TPR) repeat protein